MTRKRWAPRSGSQNLVRRVGPDHARAQLVALLSGSVSGPDLCVGSWRSLLLDIGDGHAERLMSDETGLRLVYWPRAWAGRSLGYVGGVDEVAHLSTAAVGDIHWRVRMNSVVALNRLGFEGWEEALESARDDDHPRVRAAAERAVRRMIATDH